MSKDELIDEAREFAKKQLDEGYFPTQDILADWLADFADKIAADAVRAERKQILKRLDTAVADHTTELPLNQVVRRFEDWYDKEFAAEMKEAQTDDR